MRSAMGRKMRLAMRRTASRGACASVSSQPLRRIRFGAERDSA
jgi:hypothetical protein